MDQALALSLQEQFFREERQQAAERDFNDAMRAPLPLLNAKKKTNNDADDNDADDDDDDNDDRVAQKKRSEKIAGVLDRARYQRFMALKAGADVDIDALIDDDADDAAVEGTRVAALHAARRRGQRTADATVARRMLTYH
jgi:hypothetical protein